MTEETLSGARCQAAAPSREETRPGDEAWSALPPHAKALALKWRRCVELCGRADARPGTHARFVAELKAMLDAHRDVFLAEGKAVDYTTRGGGA